MNKQCDDDLDYKLCKHTPIPFIVLDTNLNWTLDMFVHTCQHQPVSVQTVHTSVVMLLMFNLLWERRTLYITLSQKKTNKGRIKVISFLLYFYAEASNAC